MKIAYILLALLICLPMAWSVPYNTTIGPYNVSFDMGFSRYIVETVDPWIETETPSGQKFEYGAINVYRIRYIDPTMFAVIGILHNDVDQTFSSPLEHLKRWGDRSAVNITIDGTIGAVAVKTEGVVSAYPVYLVQYHPAFDPKRVNVSIVSNYPWGNGTLALLKTIHIEQTNQTQIEK